MELDEILRNSTYEISEGIYNVAKVNQNFKSSNIFMVSSDSLETTAIYQKGTAIQGVLEEKENYKLIAINVAVPFNAPGFIATISERIAKKGISVLVVSTYSRDYFLVTDNYLSKIVDELKNLGLKAARG